MRQNARLAGRVSSATTSQITVDQNISLPPGTGHQLTCTLPDGTVETRSIASVAGAVITTSSFSVAPLAQSIWSISSSSVEEQKFRCLSVGDNGDGQYTITGVEHNDSIYATADIGSPLQFDDVTLFNEAPTQPRNLQLEARQVTVGTIATNKVIASWSRGLDGVTFGFEVRYKIAGGNYINAETTNVTFEIDNIATGTAITFEVRSVGAPPVTRKSPWVKAVFTVPAPDIDPNNPSNVLLPPNPANVTIQATGDQAILRWTIPLTELNANNFIAIIRHTTETDGTGEWPNSTLLRRVEARTNYAVLPLIEGEYLLKFESEDGQRSFSAQSAVIDLPNPIPRLDIQTRREDQDVPPYQGDKVGTFYSTEYDGLVLDGNASFDDIPGPIYFNFNVVTQQGDFIVTQDGRSLTAITTEGGVDGLTSIDFIGTRLASGQYYFNNILDLGGVFSVVFERKLTTRGLYPADTVDDREELVDRWTDVDGTIADDTTADLYFRTSNQATTDEELLLEDGDFLLLEDGDKIQMESDIDFGEWTPMESGRYTGRQFQFKAELQALHVDQTPIVDEAGYTMQMESRTESSATIASGTGAKTVTFNKAFYETPNIGITASNLASGDYYEVTSPTRTGFTITFYNSGNVAIDRNFQYQAVGYGTEET
jgi:hypothetical protein